MWATGACRDGIREAGGLASVCAMIEGDDVAYWEAARRDLVDTAVCCVVNLCTLNPPNRRMVRATGGVHRLCRLLAANVDVAEEQQGRSDARPGRDVIVERTVFALCAVVNGDVENKDAVRVAGALPALVAILADCHPRSAVVCSVAQVRQAVNYPDVECRALGTGRGALAEVGE